MFGHTRTASRTGGRHASALFYGVAHALDLGGALARNRGRFGQGLHGDARALNHDWRAALSQATGRCADHHGEG